MQPSNDLREIMLPLTRKKEQKNDKRKVKMMKEEEITLF